MKCPNCDFIEKDEVFGSPPKCPACGALYDKAVRLRELKEQRSQPPMPALKAGGSNEVAQVKITDIDIPFWSMVQLMVKWALASVPAVLILLLIIVGFGSILKTIF